LSPSHSMDTGAYAKQLNQEIIIMRSMEHSNIIRLLDCLHDEANVYLVMELCVGGVITDFIAGSGFFSELQASIVMKQILSAVHYIHETHGICHRDLKPANFLFLTKDPIETNVVRLIDFGLAARVEGQEMLRSRTGTMAFMAPQVMNGNQYDKEADLWSCGVIMYILLCGYAPFAAKTTLGLEKKVARGNFAFDEEWESVSDDAKDLVKKLLTMNPNERLSAEGALKHTWISQGAPNAPRAALSRGVLSNLQRFAVSSRVTAVNPPPKQKESSWLSSLFVDLIMPICCVSSKECHGVAVDEVYVYSPRTFGFGRFPNAADGERLQ